MEKVVSNELVGLEVPGRVFAHLRHGCNLIREVNDSGRLDIREESRGSR